MTQIQTGQIWRHKKRGHLYEIVAIDAMIQLSSIGDDEVAEVLEGEDWIAYRPVDGYRLFFRMRDEFLDGRFEHSPHIRQPGEAE
ncbi:hypothetical protein [Bradyrhizobium stylosanthis]|uniref:DUF1653 domain-containing protein n=1 Tax=Bradyrhizobium stylosanthis TaxID=1803665 RepID=A0A560CXH5_9BRAD|nr:hypothetical protein [Bradyrhizobium stylosanthis]TWA89557.1 hypothetical protein FBZ96_11925 [Bradyrhizobium stylosanthis]